MWALRSTVFTYSCFKLVLPIFKGLNGRKVLLPMKPLVPWGSQSPCSRLGQWRGGRAASGLGGLWTRVAVAAHGECWHQSCVGNGEAARGEINRCVGKEIKREKERVRNTKMKGLVAPWQQLYEFPREPQAGTGIFLGRQEVWDALLHGRARSPLECTAFQTRPSPSLCPKAGFSHHTLAWKVLALCEFCNLLQRGEKMGKGHEPHAERVQPHCCVQQPNAAINPQRTKQELGGMEQMPSTNKSQKLCLTLIFYPLHSEYLENSDSCTAYGPVWAHVFINTDRHILMTRQLLLFQPKYV